MREGVASARAVGPRSMCNLTFFLGGVAKNSGPYPRIFSQTDYYHPLGAQILPQNTSSDFTPFFCSTHRHHGLRFVMLCEIIAVLPSTN